MHILQMLRIDTAFPYVGRAAQRSVVGTLNFTISNLVASDMRRKRLGTPVVAKVGQTDLTPLIEKYGNTLDKRNEEDQEIEAEQREAEKPQSEPRTDFAQVPPMILAGKLKAIRDSMAKDLDEHASLLQDPLSPNNPPYKNPYDVGASLEESFMRQLSLTPKVDRKKAQVVADIHGLDVEDVVRILQQQQEFGQKFINDNKDELLSVLKSLPHSDQEPEAAYAELPAIQKARVYVSADRGLWYERDRAIKLVVRGHPDGLANLAMIDSSRSDLHKSFNWLMKQDNFHREIDEAVRRGATWPVLIDLPKPKTAAKAA
jgi:hypothetical protein